MQRQETFVFGNDIPTDLLPNVAKFLDNRDFWAADRISKKWHTQLSTKRVKAAKKYFRDYFKDNAISADLDKELRALAATLTRLELHDQKTKPEDPETQQKQELRNFVESAFRRIKSLGNISEISEVEFADLLQDIEADYLKSKDNIAIKQFYAILKPFLEWEKMKELIARDGKKILKNIKKNGYDTLETAFYVVKVDANFINLVNFMESFFSNKKLKESIYNAANKWDACCFLDPSFLRMLLVGIYAFPLVALAIYVASTLGFGPSPKDQEDLRGFNIASIVLSVVGLLPLYIAINSCRVGSRIKSSIEVMQNFRQRFFKPKELTEVVVANRDQEVTEKTPLLPKK